MNTSLAAVEDIVQRKVFKPLVLANRQHKGSEDSFKLHTKNIKGLDKMLNKMQKASSALDTYYTPQIRPES